MASQALPPTGRLGFPVKIRLLCGAARRSTGHSHSAKSLPPLRCSACHQTCSCGGSIVTRLGIGDPSTRRTGLPTTVPSPMGTGSCPPTCRVVAPKFGSSPSGIDRQPRCSCRRSIDFEATWLNNLLRRTQPTTKPTCSFCYLGTGSLRRPDSVGGPETGGFQSSETNS